MPSLTAIVGDITTLEVDAIVNAANPRLAGGGGVDGAIHRAGGPTILRECQAWVRAHGYLSTGEAMMTGGGVLAATHVIHTVGPIWSDRDHEGAASLLANCYRNSLRLAREHGCVSVAFPSVSTGVYGFPKRPAAEIAVGTVRDSVTEDDPLQVIFCCFSEDDLRIYEELLES